ncbi:A24 family peptidase [Kordiimonas sp.]|uniref:A24 family peptidase n=1 Tax=Kordiimonas sp. TaxID=1970157 RepID=UPI003A94C79F
MQAAFIIETGTYIALAGALLTAAISDIRTRRIANWLSLFIVGLFVVAAITRLVAGVDVMSALVWPLATGLFVFLVGLGAFAAGLMGGGDVKLLAAVALMAGPSFALPFVLYTAVFGGLIAAVMLVWQRFEKEPSPNLMKVPYGAAIMAGGLWVCMHRISAVSA